MEQIIRSGDKKVPWEWSTGISVYLHCGFSGKGFPLSSSLFSLKTENVLEFSQFSPTATTTTKAAHLYANPEWLGFFEQFSD